MAAELYGICPVENVVELYRRDTRIEKDGFSVLAFLKDVPEDKKCFCAAGQPDCIIII